MTITNTSGSVKGIFSLHVITAGLSFILLLAAIALFAKQLTGGPGRPRALMKFWQSTGKRHSAASTQFFVISGLFCLMLAYATQSAIVALQTRYPASPYYVTSAYSYPRYTGTSGFNPSTQYGKIVSILSFLYQCAVIFLQTSIVGAIWISANHIHSNGSQLREPGFLSVVWNLFWMLAILALGLASWAVGLARRGSGNNARAYPTLVGGDYTVRTLFVTYLVIVIVASTSVTIEAVLCWIGIKKHGFPGNPFKSALTRIVMLVTPIVWIRNAFSVAQIVIIYYNYNSWSRRTNRALAFLFIIFGQLCDLAILALLLWGAWSFGRKGDVPYVVKDSRYSESVRDDKVRDSVMADGNTTTANGNVTATNDYTTTANGNTTTTTSTTTTTANGNGYSNGPAYVPHVSV